MKCTHEKVHDRLDPFKPAKALVTDYAQGEMLHEAATGDAMRHRSIKTEKSYAHSIKKG